MSDDSDGLYCKIALEEAFGLCGEPEDAFREAAFFMGFTDDDLTSVFPIGEKYSDVLRDGIGDSDCTSPTALRTWVLCRAWEIYKEEGETIKVAIMRAWSEVREQCADRGLWMGRM